MLLVFHFIFLIALFALIPLLNQKSLSLRILLSLALGIGYGLFLRWMNSDFTLIKELLYFVGHAYLDLLKMLVIPLILTSIIHTMLNLGDHTIHDIKKISIYSCAMLLSLTAFASLIGITVGKFFAVGQGLSLPETITSSTIVPTSLAKTLLGMLPTNPVAIMVHDNTIAVVLFAILFGIAARLVQSSEPDKIDIFKRFISGSFNIVKKLTSLILELTPYGIFALISLLLFDNGMTIFYSMLSFMLAMYVAIAVMLMVHTLILMVFGYRPWTYFKNAAAPLLVAFTTRSSFGTLPVAEETLQKKFNTNQVIATFVPSIGATIGMNACAGIFPAMLVVMTMNILHQPLTWDLVVMVMFINAIASLGISGIPGTAYIAATVTLTSLNLPYGVIALVQGIDPIIDMGRTATNVNGTMTTALVVDRLVPSPLTQTENVYATRD